MTHAKREQILWGEMICYSEDVAVNMLPWKFYTWSDMPLAPDIHFLHYSVGPNFLGWDVIPMTNDKLYEMHSDFSFYRKMGLEFDSCSIHTFEAECPSSSSIAEGIINRSLCEIPSMTMLSRSLQRSNVRERVRGV